MAKYELLTDDYVAGMLVDEAKAGGSSAPGAFPAEKRPANMPRPNTRFLKNILKAGAKDPEPPKRPPQPRRDRDDSGRRRSDPDLRRRQMRDIHAILGDSHRRKGRPSRPAEEDRSRERSERRRRHESPPDRAHAPSRKDGHEKKRRGRIDEGDYRTRDRDHERTRPHRPDNDDEACETKGHRSHKRSRRERSRSPARRRRSRSPQEPKRRRRERSHAPPLVDDRQSPPAHGVADRPDDDSDQASVGPAPPLKIRGRGAIGGAADLARRFSESYDPAADVDLEDHDGMDWDDAVEAFRDRLKLKNKQEQRMRDAGFSEDQIRRVAQASGEKTERERAVVWAKAGEKRAWDKGKEACGDYDGVATAGALAWPATLFSEET